MKLSWNGTCSLLLLVVAILIGGCGADSDEHPDEYLEVRAIPDTVVTTASDVIGRLADWAIGPEGSLFLLDGQARQIQVIDTTGRLLRTIGREGQGPGEFTQPDDLFVEPQVQSYR